LPEGSEVHAEEEADIAQIIIKWNILLFWFRDNRLKKRLASRIV